MIANYLVQVRQIGEPWKTLVGYASENEALARADAAASEQSGLEHDGRTFPRHAFVRVALRGRVICETRGRMMPVAS